MPLGTHQYHQYPKNQLGTCVNKLGDLQCVKRHSTMNYIKSLLRWDEPMGLTTVTAIITGAFAYEAPSPGVRKFFVYLSWYHLTMFVVYMCSAFTNVLTAKDFFSECLASVHLLVTGLHLFVKYITMKVREKDFLDLFRHIGTVWRGYQLHNGDYLSRTLSHTNKTTVIIFLVMSNTLFINILNAYTANLVDTENVHFPLQIWIPTFVKENHVVAGFVIQSMLFYSPLLAICMTTAFLNSISAHVEALGLALAEDIRRQKEWNSWEVRQIYRKHQEVIRIVSRVNSLMAWNWGFEMVCSSVQLTLPAYSTLRALKRNETEVFNHAFILIVNFMVIHLIFASGDRILSMGERIRHVFWETRWYESSPEDRKNILLMLFRAAHPVEYKYKIIHFDLPGFTKVVNSVFSYMALLRFFDSKEHEEELGLASEFPL